MYLSPKEFGYALITAAIIIAAWLLFIAMAVPEAEAQSSAGTIVTGVTISPNASAICVATSPNAVTPITPNTACNPGYSLVTLPVPIYVPPSSATCALPPSVAGEIAFWTIEGQISPVQLTAIKALKPQADCAAEAAAIDLIFNPGN